MSRHTRRYVFKSLAGCAALTVLDVRGIAWAQQRLVVKTFTGQWNVGARETAATPFEKNAAASVTLVPVNSVEAVAKLKASTGSPPYDVLLVDEGPRNQAIAEGLLSPVPLDRIPNARNIYPQLRINDGYGPRQSCSVMGIAYDPKRVDRPQSWAELWAPKYKGKIALNPGSATLGISFLVVAAKLNGGDERNVGSGFDAIKRLMPSVVSIPNTPAVLATLFERGEVSIAPLWNTNTLGLKAKGVSIDWVAPKEGAVGSYGHAEIAKGTAVPDLALKFVDQVLSLEAQSGMANSPYFAGPVHKDVRLPPETAAYVPSTEEAIAALQRLDWKVINDGRDAWIERWDREIKL